MHAVDTDEGLYAADPYRAEVERALIARSRRLVAVADRHAWLRAARRPVGACPIAPLSAVRTLITTAAPARS